jgi:hypothetical protein
VRKTISCFLVFLLVINLVGYYPLYIYQLNIVKREMSLKVKSLPHSELSVFTLSPEQYSQIEWESKSEFYYADNIYDVIRIEHKTEGVKIFCVKDGHEKELLSRLSEQTKSNSADPSGNNSCNLLKLFLTEFEPAAASSLIAECRTIKQTYPVSVNNYSSVKEEEPSPPPRRS